jgi:hypothetical protein
MHLNVWNGLPGEIKSSLSIQSLKLKLYNHYTQKVNACFDVNRPIGLGKRFALNVILVLCLVVRRIACSEFF